MPGIALQTLALLAKRFPARIPEYAADAQRYADQIAPDYRNLRREIASAKECLDWISEERND